MTSRDEKLKGEQVTNRFDEGLECSKRVENIISRKVSIFYIETVLNFSFQLRKIIFLRPIEKKVHKKVKFFENPLGF